MSVNVTNIRLTDLTDVTIVFSLFFICVSTSIILSIGIIMLIIFTKTLHSPMNLLICNTCLDTILYIIISIMNTSFFYFEISMSDWWCRLQAYLNYVTVNLVAYSYFIQALSRLFFTVFYKHRFLLKYRSHIILIIFQTFISFVLPLGSIISKNIIFRPRKLCLIPMKHILHVGFFFVSTYGILLILCIIIYAIIYRQVTRSTLATRRLSQVTRRDIEVIRNILIMFTIYLFAGVPGIVYLVVSITNNRRTISSAFYMFAMTASPISTLIEKISVILLNKEIKKAMAKALNKL